MRKATFLSILYIISFNSIIYGQSVRLVYNRALPQAAYAAAKLHESLVKHGYKMTVTKPGFTIHLIIEKNIGPEGYNITKQGNKINIAGGDERGLIYGSLSLVEQLRNGTLLQQVKNEADRPALALRAIKFDLPWDTYRHSYALDLHQQTCKDINFWRSFLDMMAENRFNALTLWNLHPYTFLIKPKNFPEASSFTDAEMKEWQQLFKAIFSMAKERSIDTYLVPFNIFVSPEFAKAHNVAMDNLEHQHFVAGDTSAIIKRYIKESVTQVLQEYPQITGMGLTLGEGMGGMTPQQREDWMNITIIEGMRLAKRKLKLIHRIPFSSTTGSLGPTSVETEKLTRNAIEKEAALSFIEQPVWADLKYNWSHAHSTPKLIKVHGGKLYDTYFKPTPQAYKIIWTARNEDFFCLRWGVPDFIRRHVANTAAPSAGGYMVGSETYIPAKDYFTKPGINVPWKYAFERQWLFYKLWGRLLYNAATSDTLFKAAFIEKYGRQAEKLPEAFALAGTVPLHFASLFDFTWDFSLYSEGFMALNSTTKRVEYVTVDRLINQLVTDTDYVSVSSYVKTKVAGGLFNPNKITPDVLAEILNKDCRKALALVNDIKPGNNNALMYEVADVKTWAYLGLHFSEKLKGAVALQYYRSNGDDLYKQTAIRHLTNALQFWDTVIQITRPIYNEMPLVHYSEQDGKSWKENDHLRFHWYLLREQVAADITIAEKATYSNDKK